MSSAELRLSARRGPILGLQGRVLPRRLAPGHRGRDGLAAGGGNRTLECLKQPIDFDWRVPGGHATASSGGASGSGWRRSVEMPASEQTAVHGASKTIGQPIKPLHRQRPPASSKPQAGPAPAEAFGLATQAAVAADPRARGSPKARRAPRAGWGRSGGWSAFASPPAPEVPHRLPSPAEHGDGDPERLGEGRHRQDPVTADAVPAQRPAAPAAVRSVANARSPGVPGPGCRPAPAGHPKGQGRADTAPGAPPRLCPCRARRSPPVAGARCISQAATRSSGSK